MQNSESWSVAGDISQASELSPNPTLKNQQEAELSLQNPKNHNLQNKS
jgi:hypothetical protein